MIEIAGPIRTTRTRTLKMTKVPSGMPDTFEEKLQTSLELFLFGKQAHNKLNMKIGEHNLVKNADDQIGRCEWQNDWMESF